MTKINGTQLIETEPGELGYASVSGALVSAACDYFFLRRRMSPGAEGGNFRARTKSELRQRAAARVVRVKRSDLSKSQIENRKSKIPQ